MSGQTVGEPSGTRELRLAVVLYGGVSLAIYMHGTTKELHRLVRASALAEEASEASRSPSEGVYHDLLDELAQRDPHNVRTRVVVDVIAGTSAGGINGVYLAKALAHNRPQDALRDLWLNRGDIAQLLRGPAWMPMALKVPMLLAQAVSRPPLEGDAITRWMYDALQAMDADTVPSGDLATLMPPDHLLELFVTTTDFAGYQRDLVISDPKRIQDLTHRHVFSFRYGDGVDEFTTKDNAGLALAARSTMSFPGAFPPVSFHSFEQALAPTPVDLSQVRQQLFRIYQLSDADPAQAQFIDGGVLDNRPFGHAIDAIKRRPAETEVQRRLLYLEPDPARPGAQSTSQPAPPSPLATVLAAISGIPRNEPILDDILEVTRRNERVRRIRDVIEMTFAPIAARVEQLLGANLGELVQRPSAADFDAWRATIGAAAEESAGFAYATYIRSKVSGVVERYATTICRLCDYPDDSNQAAFVHEVLIQWARTRLFTDRDGRPVAVDDQVAFLRTFDLDYGARRLQFVIDALSWWYRDVGSEDYPTRTQLDLGKRALYELRGVLIDLSEGRGIGADLTDKLLAVFAQQQIDEWLYQRQLGPEEYVVAQADALAQLETAFGAALNQALDGFGLRVFECVHAITEGWSASCRGDLLVRYLGFPFWDVLLYPIQSIADAGERDAVDIVRMSPRDATLLPPLDPSKPKLDGVRLFHFGAFFDRSGREMDYLWGRLDGAERLIWLLLGATSSPEDHRRWCRRAFDAIVREEESALTSATQLLDHARRFAAE